MTELIVALDAPPLTSELVVTLYDEGVRWFKLGPLLMISSSWWKLIYGARGHEIHLFLDLKLADTAHTCREAARHFADAGIAAVSTSTVESTEAALEGARGTPLRVWRHIEATSQNINQSEVIQRAQRARVQGAHGVICGAWNAQTISMTWKNLDIVCPGIRLTAGAQGGHIETWGPAAAARAGATHVVVGRPIWQAENPGAAARLFLKELQREGGV